MKIFGAPLVFALVLGGLIGFPNTMHFDTWVGRTAANTVAVGATGQTDITKTGTGDLGIGPNSANSALGLYAGSAGGARTEYVSLNLNGFSLMNGATMIGGAGYVVPLFSIGLFDSGTANQGGIVTRTGTGAFTVTRVTGLVTGASVGTGGPHTITVTDGTNTCVSTTIACASIAANTSVSLAMSNGAGAGCAFAAGSLLRVSGSGSICSTTPTESFKNLQIEGHY